VLQQVAAAESQIAEIKGQMQRQSPFSNYVHPDFYHFTFIL
jgi:hypothetical protein